MSEQPNNEKLDGSDRQRLPSEGDSPEVPAWTEMEPGRFMPRRVRGSCRGRALG